MLPVYYWMPPIISNKIILETSEEFFLLPALPVSQFIESSSLDPDRRKADKWDSHFSLLTVTKLIFCHYWFSLPDNSLSAEVSLHSKNPVVE